MKQRSYAQFARARTNLQENMPREIDAKLKARVDAFVDDISELIRESALQSVQEVLGGAAATPRRRSVAAAPARRAAAPARRSARSGKRMRRSAEDLQRLGAAVVRHVRATPGQRLEEIATALDIPSKQLKRPVQLLMGAGELRSEGQRRGTKYFPGARSRPVARPPARARRARRKPGRSRRAPGSTRRSGGAPATPHPLASEPCRVGPPAEGGIMRCVLTLCAALSSSAPVAQELVGEFEVPPKGASSSAESRSTRSTARSGRRTRRTTSSSASIATGPCSGGSWLRSPPARVCSIPSRSAWPSTRRPGTSGSATRGSGSSR